MQVQYLQRNELLSKIENVSRYEIDSNGNLIVFYGISAAFEIKAELKKRVVGFYDLNGEYKYDLNLEYKNKKNFCVDDIKTHECNN